MTNTQCIALVECLTSLGHSFTCERDKNVEAEIEGGEFVYTAAFQKQKWSFSDLTVLVDFCRNTEMSMTIAPKDATHTTVKFR